MSDDGKVTDPVSLSMADGSCDDQYCYYCRKDGNIHLSDGTFQCANCLFQGTLKLKCAMCEIVIGYYSVGATAPPLDCCFSSDAVVLCPDCPTELLVMDQKASNNRAKRRYEASLEESEQVSQKVAKMFH